MKVFVRYSSSSPHVSSFLSLQGTFHNRRYFRILVLVYVCRVGIVSSLSVPVPQPLSSETCRELIIQYLTCVFVCTTPFRVLYE